MKEENTSKVTQEQTEDLNPELILQGLSKMSKDIKESAATIDKSELRFLVDGFYQTQAYRIALDGQMRALRQGKDGEGKKETVMEWLVANVKNQEAQLKKAIDTYTDSNPVCKWAKATMGVGPLLSAKLYAYFNIEGVTEAGQFWSYAGLNDNNNGWLGKDLASKVVKEVIKARDEEMSSYDEKIQDLLTAKEYTTLTKLLDKKFEGNPMLFEVSAISAKTSKALTEVLGEDEDLITEFVAYISDPKLVTERRLHEIHNYLWNFKVGNTQFKRSYSSIIKGGMDRKDKSKYNGKYTKESVTAYLAKPPYNKELKMTCWNLGECIMKQCNKETSLYGRIYRERKGYEANLNKNGAYAEQAQHILETKNIGKSTDAYGYYSQGMLPPKHLNERAKRYAVKLFISHLFECMYLEYNGKPAPEPYPISHMGHVDYIAPENPYEDFIIINN